MANGTGLACPACGYAKTEVKDSRPNVADTLIRRRRHCICGTRFSTVEVIVPSTGDVVLERNGGSWSATPTRDIEASLKRRILDRMMTVLE